jgi:geranylgeranyl diphosphate synthase, type I
MTTLFSYKKDIQTTLHFILRQKKGTLGTINAWARDALTRIDAFVATGKCVRGSLVCFAHDAYRGTLKASALNVAAALELFHSGFLIHDDIMDRDKLRRGNTAVYAQYEQLKDLRDAGHFGTSMGINAGDLCFFLGFELLAPFSGLAARASSEFAQVVVGQMQDIAGSQMKKPLDTAAILSVYRYKTARYTFSFPLSAGAGLAQANPEQITLLTHLGEQLGFLFQIRDDELNAQASSAKTGKSVGSDVRNQTQTLLRILNPKKLTQMKKRFVEDTHKIISQLSISDAHKQELVTLTDFCHNRTT